MKVESGTMNDEGDGGFVKVKLQDLVIGVVLPKMEQRKVLMLEWLSKL